MKKIDTSKIKTYSLKSRESKVRINDFAKPHIKGGAFKDFFSSLPNILASKNLKEVAAAVVQARKAQRPVMLGMGAHSIKVGLNPVIIDLMARGIITSVALNGAGIIHDFELAFIGQTSEDVDKEILSGAFGMADETGSMLNEAIKSAEAEAGRLETVAALQGKRRLIAAFDAKARLRPGRFLDRLEQGLSTASPFRRAVELTRLAARAAPQMHSDHFHESPRQPAFIVPEQDTV